jgi:hypothetical protein
VQKSNDPTPIGTTSSRSRTGYAEWLALGAVAAGSVGAIVGMATCRRSAAKMSATETETLEPESITAPHGDKLRGAVV